MTKKEASQLRVGDLVEPDLSSDRWGKTDPFRKYPEAYPIKIIQIKPVIKVKYKHGRIYNAEFGRGDHMDLAYFKLIKKSRTLKQILKLMSR